MASWTARAWARSVGLETPASAPISTSRTGRSGCCARSCPTASSSVGTPLLGFRNPKYPTRNVSSSAPSRRRSVLARRHGRPAHSRCCCRSGRPRPRTPGPACSRSARSVKIAAWLVRASSRWPPAERASLREEVRDQEVVERRDDARPGQRRPHQRRQQVDRAAEVVRPGLKLDVEQRARPEPPASARHDQRPDPRVPGGDRPVDRHAAAPNARRGGTPGRRVGSACRPARRAPPGHRSGGPCNRRRRRDRAGARRSACRRRSGRHGL